MDHLVSRAILPNCIVPHTIWYHHGIMLMVVGGGAQGCDGEIKVVEMVQNGGGCSRGA